MILGINPLWHRLLTEIRHSGTIQILEGKNSTRGSFSSDGKSAMKRNRSHFKLNWKIYVASAFAGALAIWFIAYCREFYAFSDASIRPFAADVWGTVSDWAMVVVAGITGILMWSTLRSQMKVQKSQDLQTLMQVDEYTARIYPQLNIKLLQRMPPSAAELAKNDLLNRPHRFHITIENMGEGDARELTFLDTLHNDERLVGDISNGATVTSDIIFRTPTVGKNALGLEWLEYNLLLQYSDRMGSVYEQDVYARISYLIQPNGGDQVILANPVFQLQDRPRLVKHFYEKKNKNDSIFARRP